MAQYAVVSYIDGELAEFGRRMRRELNAELAHLRPHVTLLAPRELLPAPVQSRTSNHEAICGERAVYRVVEQVCAQLSPIRASLEQVQTFLPAHPTVYLEVRDGARHMRYCNGLLKQPPLAAPDEWPYVPHFTLATLRDAATTQNARAIAERAWQQYAGERDFLVKELTLVREEEPARWSDLCTLPLAE